MRKSLAWILSLLMLGFAMMVIGCSDDDVGDISNQVPNNTFDRVATIQGTVFNATDGTRINSSSLSLTLVKGNQYASPTLLKKGDSENTFAGDFVFKNVPVTLNGEATYRIVATCSGYQQFEGYITLQTADKPKNSYDGSNDNNNTVDTVYNYVRNIYMFPLGATANDVQIYVEYDDERIPDAVVQLEQLISFNDPTVFSTRVWAASNLMPVLTATTDSDGIATFSGSNLVLGGAYLPTVLPLKYEGIPLARMEGKALVVGEKADTANNLGDNIQIVQMDSVVPNENSNEHGLYIVSASNHDDEANNTGTLTITFNRAIAVSNHFSVSIGGTVAQVVNMERTCEDLGDSTQIITNSVVALTDTEATATISGNTLTLSVPLDYKSGYDSECGCVNNSCDECSDIDCTTNYYRGLSPTDDDNSYISYTGGTIILAAGDDERDEMVLFGDSANVFYLDGSTVSGDVYLYAPRP